MSLLIAVGANGSGKSLWAMHQVEHYLINDHRTIVTSLPVHLDALNLYLQKKYADRAPDVLKRIVIIGPELQRNFWRVRGNTFWDHGHAPFPALRGPYGDTSWSTGDGGCIYILDEIQKSFGARQWTQTGPEFVAYQSEHRHWSDDVIAITPASSLVEKQFRVLAAECVVLTNLYKLKVGMWKAPRKIVYRLYANCPPLPGEEPSFKGTIYIDAKALAGCYNTSQGLGIVGSRHADKGREAKGIPWYYGIAAALLLGFGTWQALRFIMPSGAKHAANRLAISHPSPTVAAAAGALSLPLLPGSHLTNNQASSPAPLKRDTFEQTHPIALAPSPIKAKLEPLPYFGRARCNGRTFIDTEAGLIEIKNFSDRGRFLLADGTPYELKPRPSPRPSR